MDLAIGNCGRSPALAALLGDCLDGGGGQALLLAHVGPEVSALRETVASLTFAQQLMQTRGPPASAALEARASSVPVGRRRSASMGGTSASRMRHSAGGEEDPLAHVRRMHFDCIQLLRQRKASKSSDPLRSELEALEQKCIDKKGVEATLLEIQQEQSHRMDSVREAVARAVGEEVAKVRQLSLDEFVTMRRTLERQAHSEEEGLRRQLQEDHEARLATVKEELRTAAEADEAVKDDSNGLARILPRLTRLWRSSRGSSKRRWSSERTS